MAINQDSDDTPETLTGNPIVNEAAKRFKLCADWETNARDNFLNDYRFAHGDSDNGFQWPNRIRANRDIDARPCLTMNIVRQHNLQIINEAKQNKSSVAFKATGGSATKESADLYQAMFQQVEYVSNAQAAYETALEYQVTGGWGWIRVVTEYEDNGSFDQCFRIKRVWDPLSIYMDMDCQEKDCSDAKYGFVFDLVPDAELDEAYPRLKQKMLGLSPLGGITNEDAWNIKDHTRVCEYFRKVPKADKLLSFIDPKTGLRRNLKKSLMPAEVYNTVKDLPLTKSRDIVEYEIEWYLIVGQHIVDRTIWPGKYIPLIRVLGEETIIDGVMDRKGHTRAMKDAQRMYNYNASAQIEFGALQSKVPWLAAAEAIEEYESMWNTANIANHSVLVFKSIDEQGNQITPPQRTEPPQASQLYASGMETAFNQMMMTSGQWQNQMGMGGNERTGAAIERRQDQGYTAVYHYANNYADALRFIGKQFIDLVPKLYDSPRLLRLQSEDGEEFDLEINPQSQQALQVQRDKDNQIVYRVLNPLIGSYDVKADVGPAYGTRREETVRSMTLLLTQNPALTNIIGDLLLSAMDFKEAQEASRRLKRMVPPQALGQGPTQAEQQLQQQVQALNESLTKSMQELGEKRIKLAGKDELRDIEVFDAQTKRLKVIIDGLMARGSLEQAEAQLLHDSLNAHLDRIAAVNEAGGNQNES